MTQKTTTVGEVIVDPKALYLSNKTELYAEVKEKAVAGIDLIELKLKNKAYSQALKNTNGNAFVRVTVELVEDTEVLSEATALEAKMKAIEAEQQKAAA